MGCELVNGIVGVCDYSASGVERLWVANKSQIESIDYNATNEVTGITFTSTGETFYEIVPALDSCTFQDTLQGTTRKNFLQTVNFAVGSLTPAVLTTLETIGLANMVAIVKTAEGDFRGLGFKGAGLRTTVMDETSGTSAGNDGNLAVTISGNAKGKAPFVTESVMNTLNLI